MGFTSKKEFLRTKRLILRLKWKYETSVSFEIFRKISDITPIGEISYFFTTGEVVYIILPEYAGAGFATEALHGFSDFLKLQDANKVLFLRIRRGNIASKKVAEKCGFVKVENMSKGMYDMYEKR